MNRDRLEHAKRVVECLRDAGVADAKKEGQDVLRMGDWGHARDHSTIACLGGWFSLDPHFREQGLRNARDTTPNTTSLVPCYQDRTAYSALALFFDIDNVAAHHIFAGWNTNRWDDAVERIDDVPKGRDGDELRIARLEQENRLYAGWAVSRE